MRSFIIRIVALAAAVLCGCDTPGGTSADGSSPGGSGDGNGVVWPGSDAQALPGEDGASPPGEDAQSSPQGYSEPLDNSADLSDLKAGYDSSQYVATILELLKRRYPTGFFIVHSVKQQAAIASFAQPSTYSSLISSLGTVVHELNHIYGFENGSFSQYVFAVREDLILEVKWLDTFFRSEIYQDLAPEDDDMYAQTYLTGDMGQQGLDTLLDEFNAYTHSLVVAYLFLDQGQAGWSTSDRDGLLAFMYFAELFLRRARISHPDDYAEITGDQGHVDLIRTLWQRAVFMLDVTEDIESLGIEDDQKYVKVFATDNLAEVEQVIGE